jgi:uncharacterized membrane protein
MTARRVILLLAAIILLLAIFSLQMNAEPKYEDTWWNATWHYRVRIEVNTTDFSRTDWPVEKAMNFTVLLNDLNVSGTFGINSTRVVEYNASGSILQELPSQFDPADDFDASANAAGEVVFILNGTNANYTSRYFYVYFDITENGNKGLPNYSTLLNYTWDNITGEAMINNSKFLVHIDTARGDNTSGIYRVWDGIETDWFYQSGANDPTMEYIKISNGTNNLTFDLTNNANFTAGPVRIRLRQTGDETVYNQTSSKTNETRIVKDYYFYPNSSWLRVVNNITNVGNSSVNRSADVGLPAFDVARAYESTYKVTGNDSNPGSWIRGSYGTGGSLTGFIHVNQSQDVFYATNTTGPDRIGIKMDNVTLESGSSIINVLAIVFGSTSFTPNIMEDTKDRLITEIAVNQSAPEIWVVNTVPSTDYSIYNRNESVFITGNVTFDPWNLTQKVNATLDMGTPSGADDQTVALDFNSSYGNQTAGYKLFTGSFNLSNTSIVGYWNLTLKAYDASGYYLNESYYIFNVTAEFFANLTIQNPLGLPDRIIYANLDVENYRQDTWIPGASINCSYLATQVTNITDNGNGTYSINFTAPSTYGLYTLNCSASKNGNLGYEKKNFTVEAAKTNVSISRTPTQYTANNVTLYNNETFTVNVTLENMGNSSAYRTNITLSVPQNWTSSPSNASCDDISISGSCLKSFNVTIPANTSPGSFLVNITANWTNLDNTTSFNLTSVNVTVSSHPVVDVPQDALDVILGPGNTSTAGNFTVSSVGNGPLGAINFSVTGLQDFPINFVPSSIPSLAIGQSQSVQVNVTVFSNQSPGIYTGVINISSSNNGFDLVNLTITVTGTNVSMESQPQNFTANVTYYQNDSFVLHAFANNTGNVTAFYASINLSIPQNWTSNASSYWCGNITKGSNCSGDFLITVLKGTPSGNYPANVTINWQDIGIGPRSGTNSTNVTVLSNRILVVPENLLSYNVSHGTESIIGTITLNSTGNDPVSSITFNVSGLNISIEFAPSSIATLAAGSVQNVIVNATVLLGYDPGTYNGSVNVTSSNDGYKVINLSITVPQNGSWTMIPTSCEKVQSPDVGYVCNVTVNVTGNLPLNFTITPATSSTNMSNYSWTNVTAFNLSKQQSYAFAVLYNVTGVAGQNWKNSNYTIDPQQSYAAPGSRILEIRLNPSLTPLVWVGTIPTSAEQTSYFVIYANATSQSGMGITYVSVNVTRPDGTMNIINMTQLYWQACVLAGTTCWYANYSVGWGQTILKGNYSVAATAFDNSVTNDTAYTTFQVYTKMMVNFSSGSQIYAQGDMGYLNYRARDYNYTALSGANTTMDITNPNGTIQGIIFQTKNYTADSSGWADTLPYFTITNDAPLGNYTATAVSAYYDSNASITVNSTDQFQFTVQGSTTQGIAATVVTTVVWYPIGYMTFAIEVHDSNFNPVDPDQLNLTVYSGSPILDIIYLQANLTSSIMHKEGTGHYIVTYNPPTSSGDYWAEIRASKGTLVSPTVFAPFRVASGGPYDVRIRLLDNEVPKGDYLDFEIIVENMGEFGQDVDIDYWVSDGTKTWYRASEATYTPSIPTPPHTNVTLLRNAYIFSSQNTGLHTLSVLVNYSSLSPPIIKNATFMVTEAGVVQPPSGGGGAPGGGAGAGGGGGGGGAAPAEIKITEYPDEMGVEAGVSRIVNIKIKNVGGADANNITLSMSGIDSSWFDLGFPQIDTLKPNETKIIPLRVLVPSGTRSGEFVVKLKAEAADTKDQKIFKLMVFTSKKELIEFELARLKAKTDELEMKANDAKDQYDVGEVLKLIGQIRGKIKEAEDYLSDQKYDAALGSIYAGWELYNKAAGLLESATLKTPVELVPMWLLIVILLLVGLILFLVVVMRKLSLNMKILLRGRYTEAKTVAGIVKREPMVENLREEKEKIERMLSLLESQYKQGIISKEAYDGLRASSEAKLQNLNERIRKELKV